MNSLQQSASLPQLSPQISMIRVSQVLLENPADFFGLDLEADITETPVG